MQRHLPWILAAAIAVGVAACRDTGEASQTSSGTRVRAASPGVGLALSRSDVSTIGHSRLNAGTVLFVPSAGFASLSALSGLDPDDPSALPYAKFTVREQDLDRLAAIVGSISDAGKFPSPDQAGSYVVCLADVYPDHTQGPPYAVVGCSRVLLDASASPTVWFGEGGVEVSVD